MFLCQCAGGTAVLVSKSIKGSFSSEGDSDPAQPADPNVDINKTASKTAPRPGAPTPVPLIYGAFLSCQAEPALPKPDGYAVSVCGLRDRVDRKLTRPKHLQLTTGLVNRADSSPAQMTGETAVADATGAMEQTWQWQVTYPQASDFLFLLTVTRPNGNFSERFTTPLR